MCPAQITKIWNHDICPLARGIATLFAEVLIAVIESPKWRTISLALEDLENFGATVNLP